MGKNFTKKEKELADEYAKENGYDFAKFIRPVAGGIAFIGALKDFAYVGVPFGFLLRNGAFENLSVDDSLNLVSYL